jgi:SnoaL-like domain
MSNQDSPAVTIARAHIEAWSNHDWEKTKELLAPNVHTVVTTTQINFREFNGINDYMELKVKAARLIEPGSLQVLAAIGDESNALIMVTFRIGMGPGGTMVTMARTGLYLLDENNKIKEERDSFFIISTTNKFDSL